MHGVQERVGRLGVQVVDDRVGGVLGARAVCAIEVARRRAKVDVAHKLHLPAMPRLVRRGALGRREVLQLQSAGTGIGITFSIAPCASISVAQIASVSAGTGICSVWPGATCTVMSATMSCMPSCG